MDITATVIELLKTHKRKKRTIEQLKFELDNPPRLSEDEIIRGLSLGSSIPGSGIINRNHISDKTMAIAMKFREAGEELMNETVTQIAKELADLETDVARMEHYLSLLQEKYATVIRMYYFNGLQNLQIAEKLGITVPTVIYRKNAATKELVAMYELLYSVK